MTQRPSLDKVVTSKATETISGITFYERMISHID